MSSIMKPTRLPESQAAFEQLKQMAKARRKPATKKVCFHLPLEVYEKLTAIKNKDSSYDNELSVIRAAINAHVKREL